MNRGLNDNTAESNAMDLLKHLPSPISPTFSVGADAGIIVERRQRDAIERHGGKVGLAPREYSSNFTSTRANRISIVSGTPTDGS